MKYLVAVILVVTLIVLWVIICFMQMTVILAPSPRGMQMLLDICSEYAAKYELKYNQKKTKSMVIKPKWIKNLRLPQFVLTGTTLFTDVTKYLGCFISNKLTDDCDINHQVRSVYS